MVAPLLHRYVTPVAVAVAVPLTGVQLVTSVFEQLTVGGVAEMPTTAWQVAVHPVVVLVTDTVYVPAIKLLIVDVVAPLLHK